MSTFLISDLHLDDQNPALTEVFIRFVDSLPLSATSLYLLGDIFEAWIGDDNRTVLNRRVAAALKSLSTRGVSVYFMHGNRDFLVKSRYAAECGMTLLADPCVHSIGGVPTLLSHGDLYCTDDAKYQAFRAKSRSEAWQKKMLRLPLLVRKALARYARSRSKKHHVSSMMISDVVESAIVQAMQDHGVKRMIHGHTHRPNVHTLSLSDGQQVERIVLADWRADRGEALEVLDSGQYHRIPLF